MERVRIGVIGTGIGAEHIKALGQVPEAVVTAVCSAQRERAEAVAARYGVSHATTDYRDLLGGDVDAVIITTPPALHRAMVTDAAAAGKHILCEKPLAVTLDDARAMVAAVERAGVVHMINHHMRFGATYTAMHDRIAAGNLGTPTQADGRVAMNPIDYLRGPMWSDSKAGWFVDKEQGGGLLAGSAGPHVIDMLRWCWGEVAAVCGMSAVTVPQMTLGGGETVSGITGPDGFLALFRFASGAQAVVRGVPLAYKRGGFRIEFNGTGGALVATNTELLGAAAGDTDLAPLPLPEMLWDRAGILARFVHAIRDGEPSPAPSFRDGLAVQAILHALDEAMETGAWVAVPDASR